MFVERYDPTGLRQGDVIADIPFPLHRRQTKPRFLGTLREGAGQHALLDADSEQIRRSWWLTSQVHTAPSHCVVLSQDCDVAPKQNPPPPSFVMCRLVPVPEGILKK